MFLYNLVIQLFNLGINISSIFKPKAKLWVNGRKNWKENLKLNVKDLQLQNSVWMHCASLGEFEQGRTVIQKIREENPSQKIVLTFFSPSGYEIQKNFALVDYVCYLPIDSKRNANCFLEILKPKIAIFVKYEFWLNFLFQLHEHKIPTFLISTVIKKHQPFFKWFGGNFRKALMTYEAIYTQDLESLNLLNQLNYHKAKLAGDTRFDRVLDVCKSPKKINFFEEFYKNAFVVIGGSTWQNDEEYLVEAYINLKEKYPKIKLIIAPHEIDDASIEKIKNLLIKSNITFHLYSDNDVEVHHSVLVLNTIGILSSIYQYGNVAFVGGGFNNGIHNLLEPSVFGLPVLFGPNHHKFNEASELINIHAGFEVLNGKDLYHYLEKFINDNEFLNKTSQFSKNYVLKNAGSTDVIYLGLKTYLSASLLNVFLLLNFIF